MKVFNGTMRLKYEGGGERFDFRLQAMPIETTDIITMKPSVSKVVATFRA